MKLEIGKRDSVINIRHIWPKEADFSDWLITDDGLSLITQDIGVEIDEARREVRPGDYPCDIVGKMVGTDNHIVVIENQFGKTNHDHLGKFLTYAAVHKAMTGIWITEIAADDHRQVIDWLNQNTPDTVNLYLAELKAFRIGESPAAPILDVICRPNVSQKSVISNHSDAELALIAWRQAFWEEIHAAIIASKQPFTLQKIGKDHWSAISIGRSGFNLNMLLTPQKQSVAIDLNISSKIWKDAAFEQLHKDKQSIEQELEEKLDWRPMLGKDSARIVLELKIDLRKDENRKTICDWFVKKLPKMYSVFKKRVAILQGLD